MIGIPVPLLYTDFLVAEVPRKPDEGELKGPRPLPDAPPVDLTTPVPPEPLGKNEGEGPVEL